MRWIVISAVMALALGVPDAPRAGSVTATQLDIYWPARAKPYYFMTIGARGLSAVTVDSEDFLLVADRLANRKFSADGVLVATIGSDSGPGVVFEPLGLTLDAQGDCSAGVAVSLVEDDLFVDGFE